MDLLWRLVANPKCGVYRRVRFYPNSKYRLGSSPRVKIENAQKSGCGGTADALVSGSSEEIRVGSNPVIRTNKRGTALVVVPFLFIRVVGFEIGRKLRSNLCEAPNSLNDCLSAKAATGGNPVIRTKKRL